MHCDKCKFDILFTKLLDRRMPAIVVRTLIYVYEEQQAWVRLGKARSKSFGIANGTWQGSVLSPALFSVYMDDLGIRLRQAGVGCHVVGVFFGFMQMTSTFFLQTKVLWKLCSRFAKSMPCRINWSSPLNLILKKVRANVFLCRVPR